MELYDRELELNEILALSWDIYRRQFKNILIVTLLVFIPANAGWYLYLMFASKMSSYIYFLCVVFNILLISIAVMGVALATENAVNETKYNGRLNWRRILSMAVDYWDQCIFVNALAIMITIILLLLIIPGLIWYIYCIFITQAVVLRGQSGKDAIDYSKNLVQGRWWKLFNISMLFFIFSVIPEFISGALPYYAGFIFDTCVDVVFAFFNVVITVLFLNLEAVNKQG